MVIYIVGYGWNLVRADCDDLEDLYQNLVDCMTADAVKKPETVQPDPRSGPPAEDATRGWRGKTSWRDRLKPQAHDDELEGDHIGGLRDVAKSLEEIPHMSKR